jgi:peptidoglycan/LPS O-acetylase OafA/YrhL
VTRLHAIDGLRGFAALIVVFHHTLMADPWFAAASVSDLPIDGGGIKRLIYYSPLHVLVAGPEAVLLFFMISGLVLAKSYSLEGSATFGYLAPRLVRLYLPIWGSLLLALALAHLRPDVNSDSLSWWYQSSLSVKSEDLTPGLNPHVINNFTVLLGTDWLNSSLWSMRVEIAISVFLVAVLFMSRLGLLGILGSLVIAMVTISTPVIRDFSIYVPYFVVGATLAKMEWKPSKGLSYTFLLLGIFTTLSPWLVNIFGDWGQMQILGTTPSFTRLIVQLTGITLITVAALGGHLGLLGPNSVSKYLSSRSYSLYLTHAPVLTLITLWVLSSEKNALKMFIWLPLGAAGILLVTELFFRYVEIPSRALSARLKFTLRASKLS